MMSQSENPLEDRLSAPAQLVVETGGFVWFPVRKRRVLTPLGLTPALTFNMKRLYMPVKMYLFVLIKKKM